jgi:hypothetical protein
MRIRGGKDYYDITLATGADEDLVFARSEDRWVIDAYPFPGHPRFSIRLKGGRIARGRRYDPWRENACSPPYERIWIATVLFAGKTYHGLKSIAPNSENTRRGIIWNGDDLRRESALAKIDLATFDETFFRGDDAFAVAFLQRHEAAIAVSMGSTDDERCEWQLDPCGLLGMGFARIIPAFQAF